MDTRICFIGDSFVNGIGDPTYLGWTGRLCAAVPSPANLTHYNLGVRGDTSFDVEQRWRSEALPRLSASGRLVFSFGVNDTQALGGQRRVALHDSLASLERTLRVAQTLAPVLVVGPPPIGDDAQNPRIGELCDGFGAVCQGLGIPYLGVYTRLSQSPIWREEVTAQDGAHPSAAGYALLADMVGSWTAWQEWVATMT